MRKSVIMCCTHIKGLTLLHVFGKEQGEVAVNRRLDRKSYTSLHKLVNGMFPARSSSEQVWCYNININFQSSVPLWLFLA